MSETFPINQEQFETWLRRVATRTPGRILLHSCPCGCLVATAVRDHGEYATAMVAGGLWQRLEHVHENLPMPAWAKATERWFEDVVSLSMNKALPIWLAYAAWKGLDPALEPVDVTAGMGDVAGVPEPEGVR